jgi:hypothetical protein
MLQEYHQLALQLRAVVAVPTTHQQVVMQVELVLVRMCRQVAVTEPIVTINTTAA